MDLMTDLSRETELLQESWKDKSREKLGTYLVDGLQNPRINMRSILTRHFLIEKLFGERYRELQRDEIRFSIEINKFYREWEIECDKTAKAAIRAIEAEKSLPEERLNTFERKWAEVLSVEVAEKISVIEPACGSANDYRYLDSYGIARFLNYKGFDITEENISNARQMFPDVRFEVGNILEIDEEDESFDYLTVQDLFEHLSPAAMKAAVREVCRVTRKGMVIGFFNMAEIPEHEIHPIRKYHWNKLSLSRTREFFESICAEVRTIWIRELLRERYGYEHAYNRWAYVFVISK